jgi:hypothetical protein
MGDEMNVNRGREGRLKPQHASLYPGLKPGVWLPVEALIRHVTDLIHRDPSKSRTITGPRLLHQDHFEYRGSSSRPEGLPPGSTRMSDAGAEPGPSGRGNGLNSGMSNQRGTTE